MGNKTTMGLCVLMGLGSLTAGFAIAKAAFLHDARAQDFTWTTVRPVYLGVMKQYFCIIPSSLPALKPLFNKIMTAESTLNRTSTWTRTLGRQRSLLEVHRLPLRKPISTFQMSVIGKSSRNDWEIELPQKDKGHTKISKRYEQLENEMSRDCLDQVRLMMFPDSSISGSHDSKKKPKLETGQTGQLYFAGEKAEFTTHETDI